MTRRLAVLLLPMLLAAAGCGPDRPASPDRAAASAPAPFADCAALTAAPAGPPVEPGTPPAEPGTPGGTADGERLPELSLPCFTGGDQVALTGVRGPAVINLWASWCAPCRRELPAFQRLADRSAGRLHVIGVNSRDSRGAAESIGEDFTISFPMLADPDEQLLRKLGRNALPLTLFVDADGRIRHLDSSGALDDGTLTELVRQHLGVVVR